MNSKLNEKLLRLGLRLAAVENPKLAPADVAATLGTTTQFVKMWRGRLGDARGSAKGLMDAQRTGRKPKYSVEAVLARVSQSAGDVIAAANALQLHPNTVRRIVNNAL